MSANATLPHPPFFDTAACASVDNREFVGDNDDSLIEANERRARALVFCNGGTLRSPVVNRETGETEFGAGTCLDVCGARDTCLAWALDHELTVGVFGGRTARQRRPLRREHNRG